MLAPLIFLARCALLLSPLAYPAETISLELDAATAAKKAVEWRDLCENRSDGRACGDLGALHMLGKGVERDEAKAFAYYEKACHFGQPARCLRAGALALNGRGTAASGARGGELLATGCRLLDPDCCTAYYAATQGLKPGLDGGMKPLADPPKADPAVIQNVATSLTLACTRGRANACGNLAGIYEEGEALPRSSAKALEYYERACELGEDERCARAARYYANGEGAPEDRAKSEKLFRRYCDLKHLLACPMAQKAKLGQPIELKLKKGSLSPQPANPATAAATPPAAATGPAPGHSDVPPWAPGPPLAVVSAEGLAPAAAAFVESCNHGSARACGNAAASFVDDSGKPTSHAELALRLYAKACALGRAIRCADLSRFYAHGWGTPVAKDREAAALKKACELGNKPSCVPVVKGKP